MQGCGSRFGILRVGLRGGVSLEGVVPLFARKPSNLHSSSPALFGGSCQDGGSGRFNGRVVTCGMRSGCTFQSVIELAREGEASEMSIHDQACPFLDVNVGGL